MAAMDRNNDEEMNVVMPLFRSLDLQSYREPTIRFEHTRRNQELGTWDKSKLPQDQHHDQQRQVHATQLQYGWNLERIQLKKLSPFHQIVSNDSVLRIPKESTSLPIMLDTIYDVLRYYSIQATFVDAPAAMAHCQAMTSTCIDRTNLPLEFNIIVWDDNRSYMIELCYVSGDILAFELLCENDVVTMLANRLAPSLHRDTIDDHHYTIDDVNYSMDVDEMDNAVQRSAVVQSLITQVVASAIHSSLVGGQDSEWWMTPQIPEISQALNMIESSYYEGTSSTNDQSVHAYRQPSYDLLIRNWGMLIQMVDPNCCGYEAAQKASKSIFFPNSEGEASYPHIRQSIVSAIVKEEGDDDDQHVIAAMSIAVRCLSLWNSEEVASFVSLLSTACGRTVTNPSFDVVDRLVQRWILSKPFLSGNATITTLTLQMLSIMMNRHLDIQRYVYERYASLIQQIYEYGSIHHVRLQRITSHMMSQCNVVAVI